MTQALRLAEAVEIDRKGFMGSKSLMRFSPTEGCKRGWYWNVNGEEVPIDYKIADFEKNRLVFRYKGNELHMPEHFLALRFRGLDGVVVSCTSKWPPHYGSANGYWQHLKDGVSDAEYNIPWCVIKKDGELAQLQALHKGRISEFTSQGIQRLTVKCYIDYKDLGDATRKLDVTNSNGEHLDEVLRALSQGWPKYRKPLLWFLNLIGYGPLMNEVVFPQDYPRDIVLKLFAQHRIQDSLAALALVHHQWLPAGEFYSRCSGHALDKAMLDQLHELEIEELGNLHSVLKVAL